MTEAQHQAAVMKWAAQPSIRALWPDLKLLYHIPNGGTRDPVEGRHLKQQGVKAGVPDLFLPVAQGMYHGLYIEMKNETGTATEYQEWWGQELILQGYCWEVCHGWKKATALLEWYLTLNTSP